MKDLHVFRRGLWLAAIFYFLILAGLCAPQFAYLKFCLAVFLTLGCLIIAVLEKNKPFRRFLQGVSLLMLAVTCLYVMNPQGPLLTFIYFLIGGR